MDAVPRALPRAVCGGRPCKFLLGRPLVSGFRPRSSACRVRAGSDGDADTNGAVVHSNSGGGRFRSSITLKRLLEASSSLGAELPGELEPSQMGKGLEGLAPLDIGDKAGCERCDALGAVACATCSCSGLYVDPVLESQGVLVKVRCLGCGGSGAIMCPACGGRGFQSLQV